MVDWTTPMYNEDTKDYTKRNYEKRITHIQNNTNWNYYKEFIKWNTNVYKKYRDECI